jgi:hypothetical protein
MFSNASPCTLIVCLPQVCDVEGCWPASEQAQRFVTSEMCLSEHPALPCTWIACLPQVWDVNDAGLQAASRVAAASDPLALLAEISQNFPSIVSSLTRQQVRLEHTVHSHEQLCLLCTAADRHRRSGCCACSIDQQFDDRQGQDACAADSSAAVAQV